MSPASVPLRPDAPAGAAPPRRWLPTAFVSIVMSAIVLGGYVVAGTLPEPDGRPVALGGVLTVRPLPGWEVVRRERISIPSPSGGASLRGEFVQLTRGSGALDLIALPGVGGGPLELADRYAGAVLARQLERLSVSDRVEGLVLRGGLEAVRFGYVGSEPRSGSAVEGSVTAVVAPSGNGVVFDGWAFRGQLELIAEELASMIDRARVA